MNMGQHVSSQPFEAYLRATTEILAALWALCENDWEVARFFVKTGIEIADRFALLRMQG